jgi:uncharacterized C2H2 Zn-finger protein
MSQKKSPVNEPSNERGSQSDTQINEPSNEKSSQSGTQGNQRSGQNPMPTGTSPQNKCGVCEQTFSNQNELHNHYKTAHNMEAPAQQSKGEGGSSSSGSKWSGEMSKEAGSVNKGNETSSTQSGERDTGPQKQMRNQYKCQRCGQLLSNQNDLNQHNKSAHGIEPKEMGKETGPMKETKEMSKTKSSEHDTWTQNKTQNQYKCQKDGQTFSSQNDLNEHNKKVHGTEPGVTK